MDVSKEVHFVVVVVVVRRRRCCCCCQFSDFVHHSPKQEDNLIEQTSKCLPLKVAV